jgi:hypothetical protein
MTDAAAAGGDDPAAAAAPNARLLMARLADFAWRLAAKDCFFWRFFIFLGAVFGCQGNSDFW